MSKKDKSKFRRRLKAQILQDMASAQAQKPASTPSAQSAITQPIVSPKIPARGWSALGGETAKPDTSPVPGTGLQVGASVDTLQFVRADLKKSAIIIGSIIVLIVVLYFVDQRTGILLKASNEIFKVLHIGA